jgi:hypothetical protein
MQRFSGLAAAHRLWLVIRDDVPAEPPEEEEKPYVGLHTPDSDAVATPAEYDVTDCFTARPRRI